MTSRRTPRAMPLLAAMVCGLAVSVAVPATNAAAKPAPKPTVTASATPKPTTGAPKPKASASPGTTLPISETLTPDTQLPAPKAPLARPTLPTSQQRAAAEKAQAATDEPVETLRKAGSGVAQRSAGASRRTLVLYDSTGPYAWLGEAYGIAGSNLATHFGDVTATPVGGYTAGMMAGYDAVLYFGSTYNEVLPTAFIADVTTTDVPVIWSGFNVWQLTGTGSAGPAAFEARYGWDAASSWINSDDQVSAVAYKGRTLTRDGVNGAGILAPHVTDATKVTVLADAVCGSAAAPATCAPIAQSGGTSFPWAVRSANLTYIGEIPFSYMGESDRYLAFADLLYAPLAPTATPVRKAAVRLEDVSPMANAADLRAFADYLWSQNVPFSVAVIPEYHDPKGTFNGGVPQTVTLAQRPAVVSALKYMQTKGGTLIQHGTTHQFAALDNPYNGVTGDDFEFFAAKCTTTPTGPFTFVPCETNTHVQTLGSLPGDTVSAMATRVTQGRTRFTQAGIAVPTIFEVPHYAASQNSYAGIGSVYATRYERALYFEGQLTGATGGGRWFGQFFPYSVTDVHGTRVLPENLGNYEPDSFSGHPARLPADIVANAEANLAVTESTASLFFHPYFPLARLQETVTGIKGLGYTFVPATDLP